jgi:hypothetical protein
VAESGEQAAATMELYDAFVDEAAMARELQASASIWRLEGRRRARWLVFFTAATVEQSPKTASEVAARGLLHPDPDLGRST